MTEMHRRDVLRILGSAGVGAVVTGHAAGASALELGKPAPGFTLPDANGERVGLKQFRGKHLVLVEFFGAAFAPT
jgi:hypothetical protein